MLRDVARGIDAFNTQPRHDTDTTPITYLGSGREVLRDSALTLRRLRSFGLSLSIAIFVVFAATTVATFPGASNYGRAIVAGATAGFALRLLGYARAAALVFSVGMILAECVGIIMGSTRPEKDLILQMQLASASHYTMGMLGTAWFVGGCSFGVQPLPAHEKLILCVTWLACMSVRCNIVGHRCSEDATVSSVAMMLILPITCGPGTITV